MQNQFKVLTLTFKNAPIQVREAVALNEIACRNLLDKVKEFTGATDVLVLSTCNRTEVYYAADCSFEQELIKLISIEKGFSATSAVVTYFRHIDDHDAAVRHLFNVALGLESQVVGDVQILNQVKNAYQWAADAGTAGPFLHRLLHTIFSANKLVVNETAFRTGAASVSYATVELVEELTQTIGNPRVLIIGVGDMGREVCLNFQKSEINNLVVVNRTHHKAQELAQKSGARAVYWENVWEEIEKADVVISAVPGDCFFISREKGEQLTTHKKRYFIDMSMPRSVDSSLETLANTYVYNIDNIRNRTNEALEKRLAAIPYVHQIIEEAATEFDSWTREMAMSPALQQFKNTLEQIRQQEIARYTKKLGAAEKDMVEAITRNILNKIVKMPALELKAACQRGEAEALLGSLATLFDLEKEVMV
ncbi:glutamyl-tRNA reductase [Pontibacter qinzhouensis]|uniref:Glutamyl-tRNA reductase n=1 Tax=Pontibacter qinzhouensis TaxID=2603253 RepID=A0A5C8J8T1_9BACT|nr:glutamyl-tRNA reductase [Pontibacter qinzhouensis]TXK33808.1 glutamyl-tRNA reductase [Pontibacter qinzhouensis]